MMKTLLHALYLFTGSICALPFISQKGCISDPADIVFLLDSSGSIGQHNFQKDLHFIAEFAKHYVIGPNNVQIGVVSYSNLIFDNFQMHTHKNINDLEAAITRIPYSGHSTHTGEALHYVGIHSFTPQVGDRSNVPNFLIVITDGHSDGHASVSTQAKMIHNSTNIETFAIGVGKNISKSELDVIASSPNHVLLVLLVSDHLNLHIPLHEIHCDSKTTVTPDIWRPITTAATLSTSWFVIGSGYMVGPSGASCQDSTLFNCNSGVCAHLDLAKYCPVTCGACVPCKDSTLFTCNPAVCSDPGLKKYCPLTCGSCV